MPTYEYKCLKCGKHFDVMQSFSDAPVSKCIECNGKVRKVFSPPAIIFKGKGFHCTDYKSSSGGGRPSCARDTGEAKTESKCDSASDDCKGKCAAAS